jgi:hypothetical protein
LQRYKNKALLTIANPPWYKPKKLVHTDLMISTVREKNYKIQHHNTEIKNNTSI